MNYPHLRLTALLLFLLMLVLPLPGCIWIPPPGSGHVETISLDVSPAEVKQGTPAIVTVAVVNNSKIKRPSTVILKVYNIERAREDILLPSGSVQVVTFELVEDIAGVHTLSVDGQAALLKVTAAGLLEQDLSPLEGSDGKIVHLEPFEVASPYSDEVDVYKIRYLSDGLEVVGFILKPKRDDRIYPVIIYNHGWFKEYGIIDDYQLENLSMWAAKGYVVVASQYR
ncbi:MAG: hypothetical protein P8105_09435 [Dehalococcoidia bacterium]